MPVYPTIIPTPPPVIVTTGGAGVVTYNEINRSQTQFIFDVKKIYIKAASVYDLPTDLVITRSTPDGKSILIEENIEISPNQIQGSYELIPDTQIMFDGYTSMNLNIAPNSKLQVLFDTEIIRRIDVLK